MCGPQKQSNDPGNNQHNPQYANYWAPLTRKRHIMPHPAQPQHANYWAPRTRKRHQQEHRPQRPTKRSDPTQHAKGRTGDRSGPRKGTTTRRNVTQGGGGSSPPPPLPFPHIRDMVAVSPSYLQGGGTCAYPRRSVQGASGQGSITSHAHTPIQVSPDASVCCFYFLSPWAAAQQSHGVGTIRCCPHGCIRPAENRRRSGGPPSPRTQISWWEKSEICKRKC